MGKFDGFERDTNAVIRAILFEIEDAASQPPEIASHPYELEKRRKRVVRRIWGLAKRAMTMLETADVE